MKIFTPLLVLLCLGHFCSMAQSRSACGTTISQQQLKQLAQFRPDIHKSAFRRNSTIRNVAVSAHLIHQSDGSGGLTEAEVEAAMAIVNSYYSAADLEFFLAKINHIDDSEYYSFNTSQEVALGLEHDVPNTVNIYFANSVNDDDAGSLCGYAYFPGGPDRILMDNSCAMNGSTLTHEIGHYLALFHTHGKSDSLTDELVDGSNCETAGDEVCDTPADPKLSYSNVNSNCAYTGSEEDANGDPFDPDPTNIMSYSRKECRDFLSDQQYFRASEAFSTLRTYLYDRKVVAGFTSDWQAPCVGSQVHFTSTSLNAQEWHWVFEGANPSTSTDANPVISYSAPGAYDVMLAIAGEGGEQDTLSFEEYIHVIPEESSQLIAFKENFETDKLQVGNPDDQMTFALNSQVSTSGARSIMLNFYDYANVGQADYLVLPFVDNSFTTNYEFSFDYAYTYYDDTYYDGLSVVYREACQPDWQTIWSREGQSLATREPVEESFVPTTEDWESVKIDLAMLAEVGKFELAFKTRNGYGNNLYIDNIALAPQMMVETTDYSCIDAKDGSVTVVPSGSRNYSFKLDGEGFKSSPVFMGLSSGIHYLSIRDDLNRVYVDTVEILGAELEFETSNISCYEVGDGTLEVNIISPRGAYQIYLDGKKLNGTKAENLRSGRHVLEVLSVELGCRISRTFELTEPQGLELQVNVEDASCFGEEGHIQISTKGGVAPYELTLNPGGRIHRSELNLSAGQYELSVSDNNDCSESFSFNIEEPDSLSLDYSISGLLCEKAPEGFISFEPAGGVGGYEVFFDEKLITQEQVALNDIGGHVVKVVDGSGCEYSEVIELDYQYETLEKPKIKLSNGQLLIDSTDAVISWYLNDQLIVGASKFSIPFDEPGVYQVRLAYGDGTCDVFSEPFVILSAADPLLNQIRPQPNPFTSSFQLRIPELLQSRLLRIVIFDLSGQLIQETLDLKLGGELPPGVYLVAVEGEGFQKTLRVIKSK